MNEAIIHFNALLNIVLTGRTQEFEMALESYLLNETLLLKKCFSGTEFELVRIVLNRRKFYLRSGEHHISFSELSDLLGPDIAKSVESRLAVVSVLRMTYSYLYLDA